MGGRPFQANSQAAVLSPFSVPAYVLPFWDSLAVMAALKLFVAAFGAFLLARTFGMRFAGALMCGLVFGFSLWSVSWVSWTTMSVWALLPWLCLLAELCVRRPGPLPFAGLAAVTGLQFLGGHPSTSFQVMVAVTAFWVVRAFVSRPLRERDLPLRLFTLGAALVTGTALAAITLIPFVELLSHSIDLEGAHGRRLGRSRAGPLPARDLPARLVGARIARAAGVRLVARGARLVRRRAAADARRSARWCFDLVASGSWSPPRG